MLEAVQSIVKEVQKGYADTRLQVFDVQAQETGSGVSLTGRLLDEAVLQDLRSAIECQHLPAPVDFSALQLLRNGNVRILSVATNLTGLYAGPSWLAEMLSQLFYGWKVEILEELGRWAFVRLPDGYLGWAYLPYLTAQPAPEPTHLVVAPVGLMRTECPQSSDVIGRLLGGTAVQVVSINGTCVEVDAHMWGWLGRNDVRALQDLPATSAEQRAQMVQDAARLVGVPYLWGGCSGMGIDCSGLAQLVHRWVGVTIPRDADLQAAAGRKIEPPFQPGDLLFFGEGGESRAVTHVAISLGGWRIIHSSRSRNGVYIDDVQEVPHLRDSFLTAATFL